MIAHVEDMELTLECFAQEAADRIAQLWNERTGAPLSDRQKHELVDGIWECLFPGNRGDAVGPQAEAESQASSLVHST